MLLTPAGRVAALLFLTLLAARPSSPLSAQSPRDGQHDFDFHIGTWTTTLARLRHPLSGDTAWVHYTGTTVVRKVWNGLANLVELEARGPAGSFQALSLRLYNPAAHQWSLNFSNSRSGTLSETSIGEFRDGRGEFISQEPYGERTILVRFVVLPITRDSVRFEQSFSDNGGRTWELNWIATDVRARSGASPP
jgi:hypothetical protein